MGEPLSRVRRTKPNPDASVNAPRPRTKGEAHPRCGASFRAISSAASAKAIRASEMKSIRPIWAVSDFSLGRRRLAPTAQATPGPRLIRKSQCQEKVWVIQPPTIGPTVGAKTATTPAMVVAIPCRRSGNSRKTAAKTAGIRVPPEKPWITRQMISTPKS